MVKQVGGKVALVTGAASGIGRATALAFAGEGAEVVVADIDAEGGRETVKLIEEASGEATFVRADVSQPADVEVMVQGCVDVYGRLDFGINNAGVEGAWARTADVSLGEWERVLAINLTGVFNCMRHEIPVMLKQGGGAIVNVASIAGLRVLANSSAYSASKHGVIGLTKAAALEYARQQIRINAVCPVFTRTPMLESLLSVNESYEERLKRNIPMRRYGTPEDIAAAILWLCSDAAGFVTGHALPLDGGIMAG
jgi:NAD(P)-dependent dehydrogenase (short-subunit alcohol dehydrogenase family)